MPTIEIDLVVREVTPDREPYQQLRSYWCLDRLDRARAEGQLVSDFHRLADKLEDGEAP